jgi:hypothetical protein
MACSFFATYTMSGIFLVLGSLSFLAGTRRYTYKEPGGDAVVGFGHYLWQMARWVRGRSVDITGKAKTRVLLTVA